MRTYKESDLKAMVIKLRKRHREIQDDQVFCSKHNFNIEAEFKRQMADEIQRLIHNIEHEFDLGFVWDESLNR